VDCLNDQEIDIDGNDMQTNLSGNRKLIETKVNDLDVPLPPVF